MSIKISMQREVKERIRKEIIEAAQQYAEEYEIENYTDTASALNCVYAEFKNQFDWKIKQIGEHNAFIEWLKGLPMQFDYSYFDIRERIKYWFNQSNEEASKYSDEQVDKLYWNLLAREFFALVKKFNVSGIIKSEDNAKVTPYDMDDYLDNDNVLEESNILVDNDNMKMSDVDFQELYNAVNNEKKKIDEKYFYKYMNKGNKNKTFDGSGLKIFKLLPDGLKLRLYNKWKKYLSVDEINSALDKVAEKLLSNNNALEESNIEFNSDLMNNIIGIQQGRFKVINIPSKYLQKNDWLKLQYTRGSDGEYYVTIYRDLPEVKSDIPDQLNKQFSSFDEFKNNVVKMIEEFNNKFKMNDVLEKFN